MVCKPFVWTFRRHCLQSSLRRMGTESRLLLPREAAAFVASRAQHVRIDSSAVDKFAPKLLEMLRASSFRSYYTRSEVHPEPTDPRAVDWIFLCSTLNFCFWHEGGAGDGSSSYIVEYAGKKYSGYFGLCAALKRAVDEGVDVTNPAFYSAVTEEQLASILRSADDRPVPLLEKRVKALRDAGEVLLGKFDGSALNLVTQAGKSAEKLLSSVVENFKSYKDECVYEGQRLGIYKRAQIFIADLWACFEGKGLGEFGDISFLTAFADYRIPQILETVGILMYDEHLRNILESGTPVVPGSVEEVEIRACTLHAVELLKGGILMLLPPESQEATSLNSALLDHHLWDFCKAKDTVLRLPYHRTRSWFY